jgi:pimeloyl-ACP methyl ester carboxylesterase
MDSIAGGSLRIRLYCNSMLCAFALFTLVALGAVDLHAQEKVLRIDAPQTDPAIESVEGPQLAIYNPQVPSNHRLFLFFVGTDGKPERSLNLESAFADWGYHAIALDYENHVVTVVCAHSTDSACFDHYREANITGAPVSDKITVSRDNSILNRLNKMLAYLVRQDPEGGWGEFFADGQPVWSRIVVAGHSQGAGHAAYLGKMFPVDAVLMFSGPQDYLADLDMPAPWLARPGATPQSRYFAFLNVADPYNVHYQIANCSVLMGVAHPATPLIQPGDAIKGDAQIFLNDADPQNAHGTTLLPEFNNVREYFARIGAEGSDIKPALSPEPPPPPQPIHPQ